MTTSLWDTNAYQRMFPCLGAISTTLKENVRSAKMGIICSSISACSLFKFKPMLGLRSKAQLILLAGIKMDLFRVANLKRKTLKRKIMMMMIFQWMRTNKYKLLNIVC